MNQNSNQTAAEKTPLRIMMRLRQRRQLAATDTSEDATLEALSPMEKLREVCAWELGDPSWADQFLTWANECGVVPAPR